MNALYVFVPITLLGLGVAGIVSYSYIRMQGLKNEEARLRSGDPADLDELMNRTAALERDLAEVQDRLDFTERMLAQDKERSALPPAPGS